MTSQENHPKTPLSQKAEFDLDALAVDLLCLIDEAESGAGSDQEQDKKQFGGKLTFRLENKSS